MRMLQTQKKNCKFPFLEGVSKPPLPPPCLEGGIPLFSRGARGVFKILFKTFEFLQPPQPSLSGGRHSPLQKRGGITE